jgi:hypothetical protein
MNAIVVRSVWICTANFSTIPWKSCRARSSQRPACHIRFVYGSGAFALSFIQGRLKTTPCYSSLRRLLYLTSKLQPNTSVPCLAAAAPKRLLRSARISSTDRHSLDDPGL